MKHPKSELPLLMVLIAIAVGALVVLVTVLPAYPQDCPPSVEEATDSHLRHEIAVRGWDSWGCWTTTRVRATWTAPIAGTPVVYYILRVHGWGYLLDMQNTYKYVYGTTLDTMWPAWTDSFQADVCGVDDQGRQGYWSEVSDIYVVERW